VRFTTPALLCGLLAIAVYAIAIYPATLIYDDVSVIRDDERLRTLAGWQKLLTQSYNGGLDNLYRPLVSATYVIQYQLHGATAWPYRLVNVLLHGVATSLVVVLARRLTTHAWTPAVAGVLFAVHPVHAEAVVGVVGRAELMCTIGFLGALICVTRPITARRAVATWALGILALLSKEQGMLLLPAGICAYVWTKGSRPPEVPGISCSRGLLIAAMFTLAGYIVFRESTLKFWWDRSMLDAALQPMIRSEGIDRVLMPVVLAGQYLHLLIVPHRLSIDYAGDVIGDTVHFSGPYLYLGLVAIGVWTGLAVVAWLRRDVLLGVCVVGFALSYGVVANIVTLTGVNMAERLMYLPSVFVVMIMAHWIAMAPRRVAATLVVFVALLGTLRTTTYIAQWNDRLAFYTYSAAIQPTGPQAAVLVSEELQARGDLLTALHWARQATDRAPRYERYWNYRAKLAIDAGQFVEARDCIQRGMQIRDTFQAPLLLGLLYERQGASTQPAPR
jgi:protein O-mannosyl-transferase